MDCSWFQTFGSVASGLGTVGLLFWGWFEFTVKRKRADEEVRQAIKAAVDYAVNSAEHIKSVADDFEGLRDGRHNRLNLIVGLRDAKGLLDSFKLIEVRPNHLIGALIRARNAARHLIAVSEWLLMPNESRSNVSQMHLGILAGMCVRQLHVLREVQASFEKGVETNTPPPEFDYPGRGSTSVDQFVAAAEDAASKAL